MVHADPVPGVEALRRRRLLVVVPASVLVMTGDRPRRVRAVTTLRERRRERWRAARPAIAWTLGAFTVALVIALAATASLGEAQQACVRRRTPCPDATDPPVRVAPVRVRRACR